MSLSRPPETYNVEDQAQMRATLDAMDRANIKKGVPITGLIFKAPNGSKWELSVSNAGGTVWTAL